MDPTNQWAVTSQLTELPEGPAIKDRSTGLTIYGCLLLAMGGLSALMVPFMALSLAAAPSGGATGAQMVPAIVVYAFLAVAFFSLGIGSIRARRWARALTLVLSWMWLVMGVVTLVSMVFFMPSMSGMMAAQPNQPSPMMMNAILTIMMVMMVGMYIVVPGVFIVFYQRSDVKETCERRDPQVRWTDHCPLPVLALCLVLAFGATSVVWTAGYGFVVPFFGIILKGVPGAILMLCVGSAFGYLAWANYKLKMAAWWATLGAFALFGLSTIISFAVIDMIELYREMGFPKEQLAVMENSGALDMNYSLMMSLNVILFVGYLLWIRKHYRAPAESASPAPA